MRRLLLMTLAVFVLSASIATAKAPIPGFSTQDTCAAVFTEDAQACGQDINYHAFDSCVPYPIVNAPYSWYCYNERDGWHPHYARI
jgi:hypothetical protein